MDKIGVVVLNYITWQQTEQCIKSIKKSMCSDEIVIYVVDNASPDKNDIQRICQENKVEYIQNNENLGYAAGNNVGIKKALEDGCDYILISNNDMLYHKECISNMKCFLEQHNEYGIVGPRLYDKHKNTQKCHFIKQPQYKDIWKTQTLLRFICKNAVRDFYGSDEFYEEMRDVYAVSGCSFMMTSKCARQVTPLDENTFLYYEEAILGYRMKQKGIKTVYNPNCKAIHNHDQTTRLVKPFALTCSACSEMYYCKTYLNCSYFNIWVLYIYRSLIYKLHSLKDKSYVEKKEDYKTNTKNMLRKISGKL